MRGPIDLLRSLNRKERFYLVGMALGKPSFSLSDDFRRQLREAFNLEVPADAPVAMDYHLNWIQAAKIFSTNEELMCVPHGLDPQVAGNQEDVDLLVAFRHSSLVHLLLLEAKGATGWTDRPMRSKASRLRAIFGEDGEAWPGVQPRFALVSPRPPQRLKSSDWPRWMRDAGVPLWIPLPMPRDLLRVTRCDDAGTVGATGTHWLLNDTKYGDFTTEPD